jgi:hypothetical protein
MQLLADVDRRLAAVHIDKAVADRMGVGRWHMVAAGKAPNPPRLRSTTFHSGGSTY